MNPETGNMVGIHRLGQRACSEARVGNGGRHKRMYVAISDCDMLRPPWCPWTELTWGSYAALAVATGKILWQTADTLLVP